MPQADIRNAHEPIMMGNAAIGLSPSSDSVISDGAYIPMPNAIRAPRTKCTPIAIASGPAPNVSAVPPPGIMPRFVIA